jgi:hypothetical protein
VKTDVLIYVDRGLSDADLEFNGAFVPEELARSLSHLDAISTAHYSIPRDYTGRLSGHDGAIVRDGEDDVDFWKQMFSGTGADHLIRVAADSPFIDASIIGEMAALHLDSLAEFTYSENLPSGMTCEIVARELVNSIPDFDEKTLPLSQVVRSNMNQFDIELYYRDPDIRDKRLSFRVAIPVSAGSWKILSPQLNQFRPMIRSGNLCRDAPKSSMWVLPMWKWS